MVAPKGHEPYNTKGEGGAPTIYTDEFIENEAKELEEWLKDKDNELIFLNEFSFDRGYHRRRIPEFCERSERFSLAVERARERQENKLILGAMTRKYDGNFTKFVMPRLCGDHWQEVKNVKVTSTGPVPPWIEEAEGKSKDLISG